MLTDFQRQIAQILGEALQPYGFALGGGQALQAHNVIDRPSKDLGNYSESLDPDVYEAAERSVLVALRSRGYTAEVTLSDSWFRQIIVSDPVTGEKVGVDLGYDYREKPPAHVTGIGPVLDIQDVVTGKVRALVDRQAERDYMDIDAVLSSGGWTVEALFDIVREIRPELSQADLLAILSAAHEGDPEEYAALGLNSTAMAKMFVRLSTAVQTHVNSQRSPSRNSAPHTKRPQSPRCLACGRPLRSQKSVEKGYGPSCAKKLR